MFVVKKVLLFCVGLDYEKNKFLYKILQESIVLILIIFLLVKNKEFNLRRIFKNKILTIILGTILIYFSLSNTTKMILEHNLTVSNAQHTLYFCLSLFVGLFEELAFRLLIFGYVYCYFKQKSNKPLFKSIIVTSSLFALSHLINIFNGDYDFPSVINQMLIALLLGLFLQSFFVRFNNILLNGLIHGLINYNGMVSTELLHLKDDVVTSIETSGERILSTLITVLVFSVFILPICYLLLKKHKVIFLNLDD